MVVFAVEKYISRHDLSDNGSEWLRVDQSALRVDRSGSVWVGVVWSGSE